MRNPRNGAGVRGSDSSRVLDQAVSFDAERRGSPESGSPPSVQRDAEVNPRTDAVWGPATRSLYRRLERIARSDATVLITGETGTGKEVVARTLHSLSRRSARPLIAVNCAALSSGLLESELFGHEKGAFTGAIERRKGRFELAGEGMILLDEIGELDLELQPKLLRVLQERLFERVGSSTSIRSDVQVVATTNRDLLEEAERGRFRKDLYYRLKVLHLHVPPLRERHREIEFLTTFFARESGVEVSREVLDVFSRYTWPGNVRELKNVIDQAAVLAEGPLLRLSDLPSELTRCPATSEPALGSSGLELKKAVAHLEQDHILRALTETSGSQRRAAKLLGISRGTLEAKMSKYGLRQDSKPTSALK